MSIASNLTLRILAVLLVGFVALQLLVYAVTALPSRGDARRPYNLPLPGQAAAIAAALERTPAADRPALVDALDASLYTVRLAHAMPAGAAPVDAELARIAAHFTGALAGRAVVVQGRTPRFGRLLGTSPRPGRLFAPVRVSIALRGGDVLVLTSRPSAVIRSYMRGRAAIGAVGGLLVLAALMLAIRQTTRPLVRLSQGVRGFGATLDAPDLPVAGPREVRGLATAFNEMKTRIRELMDERTRILAAIAHDMRTYLTRLRLRAEFIDDPLHRERAARDLDEMTALLNDTLFLAQGEAAPVQAAAIDLSAECAATIAIRRELGDAVTFEAAGPLWVRVAPLSLRRILGNLIDNGLRHGTAVMVRAEDSGAGVELVVEDDGPGVPEAALVRLGEPFGRIDPSRNRDAGGAGLGLAIVRALAVRDGASLSFANRAEGGLRVVVRYPA
ncbi:ATP-binding protein [Sphingomonas sp. CJ20]